LIEAQERQRAKQILNEFIIPGRFFPPKTRSILALRMMQGVATDDNEGLMDDQDWEIEGSEGECLEEEDEGGDRKPNVYHPNDPYCGEDDHTRVTLAALPHW
jgi:hypothetical protein